MALFYIGLTTDEWESVGYYNIVTYSSSASIYDKIWFAVDGLEYIRIKSIISNLT